MGYLDNNGLQYLWGKIKSYVLEHCAGIHHHAVYTASKDVDITAANTHDATPAAGASLTLPPGTYILVGYGVFGSVSASPRSIQVAFFTGSSPTHDTIIDDYKVRVFETSSWWQSLTAVAVVKPAVTTTYTVGLTASVASPNSSTRFDAISIPT